MHIIRTAEAMARAMDSPLDPKLKAILHRHVERLEPYGSVSDLAHFIIVEPGDCPTDINVGCGVEVVGAGAATFATLPELAVRHGGWFEITFILSDDGFGLVLFVQRGEGTDPNLLAACTHALEQHESSADKAL